MKLSLIIGEQTQEEIIIYAKSKSKLVEDIERLVNENQEELIGYADGEGIYVNYSEVHCFTITGGKVYAHTKNQVLHIKSRLYKLEENLPRRFVKINQSCIANISEIERFDASISGTLRVTFKNGYSDYVSRRKLKTVKERLGIK